MSSGRNRVFALLGVLALLAVFAGVLYAHRPVLTVPVVTVAEAPFVVDLPESGVVQYPQIQTMSSQIAGNLGRVLVKPGDRVRAGQLLATIENPQILANAQGAGAAYRSAAARAQSAQVTGGSNVVQAQANLETARARLAQAEQDASNGLQSGFGYGETTATEQRALADASLATAATSLRQAHRVYVAYQSLYANRAVSRDQLDQAEAKYEQAQGAYDQARLAHAALGTQLAQSHTVLEDSLRSAREGYAQAQAQLAAARVEAAGGDVAAASAEAQRAASDYAFAREQAESTQVRAPYDATVLSVAAEKSDPLRPLQPGDEIELGQRLLTLAAGRVFVVRTKIDEQDAIGVSLGQRAEISGEDFPGRTLSGRVAEISPIAVARLVAATIRIEGAPAYLRDGMRVDVSVRTTDLPRALAVPSEALFHEGATAYVYVVQDGVARRRVVRAGSSNEASTQIESGLAPGDVVVARGLGELSDGAAVSPHAPQATPSP